MENARIKIQLDLPGYLADYVWWHLCLVSQRTQDSTICRSILRPTALVRDCFLLPGAACLSLYITSSFFQKPAGKGAELAAPSHLLCSSHNSHFIPASKLPNYTACL